MTPEHIQQMVNRCMAAALELYGASVGDAPEIRLDLRGQAAGQASGGKLIRLNQPLLDANPDQWEATVIHELAHVITWRLYPRAKAHGWQWREINEALGGVGQVCHHMDTRSYRTRTLSYYCYRTASGGEVWLSSIRHRRAQKNLKRWGGTGYLTAKGDPIEYWVGECRRGSPSQLSDHN